MDYAHRMTDKQIAELEARLSKVYREAEQELNKTIKGYFKEFEARDDVMKAKLDAGKINEEYYKQWRLNQIGRGQRYEALRDKCAERITDANVVASHYINDAIPSAYALNRNYLSYTIEKSGASVDFTIWNESAVKRLIVEQPETMPHYPEKRAVKRGIDLKYGKEQITASITSSILQGKTIPQIAENLMQRIRTMDKVSATRAARTAFTAAENGGRMDAINEANKMGIKAEKRWLSIVDGHTRDSHRELNGVEVPEKEEFPNGLMFPGDSSGDPSEVYNCRCSMRAVLPQSNKSKTGNTVESYNKWKSDKESKGKIAGAADSEGKIDNLQIKAEKMLSKDYNQRIDDYNLNRVRAEELDSFSPIKADFSYVDYNIANAYVDTISELSEDYKTSLVSIGVMGKEEVLFRKHTVAYVSPNHELDQSKMVINQVMAHDYNKFIDKLKERSNKWWIAKGVKTEEQALKYIPTHEFAHTLLDTQSELNSKRNWVNADYKTLKAARKEITALYSDYLNAVKETEAAYKSAGTVFFSADTAEDAASAMKLYKEKTALFEKTKISNYSMSNPDEFLAESFASVKVLNSDNAFALKAVSIIDKYYKR